MCGLLVYLPIPGAILYYWQSQRKGRTMTLRCTTKHTFCRFFVPEIGIVFAHMAQFKRRIHGMNLMRRLSRLHERTRRRNSTTNERLLTTAAVLTVTSCTGHCSGIIQIGPNGRCSGAFLSTLLPTVAKLTPAFRGRCQACAWHSLWVVRRAADIATDHTRSFMTPTVWRNGTVDRRRSPVAMTSNRPVITFPPATS